MENLETKWEHVDGCVFRNGWRALRVGELPSTHNVFIAKDGAGFKHLLVLTTKISSVTPWKTRGLEVTTGEFGIGDSQFSTGIRFSCTDNDFDKSFLALAESIVRAIRSSPDPAVAAMDVAQDWRLFWSSQQVALTAEQELGLFGEVWTLNRYMDSAIDIAIPSWNGPLGARHDFQFPKGSIEVKTTSRTGGAPVVRIANLDQLSDAIVGTLSLFVMQVSEDALSANGLVSEVRQLLAKIGTKPVLKATLLERLLRAGYSPLLDDQLKRRFRVQSERLYGVTDTFPRMITSTFEPNGLPSAIGGITYTLDTAALDSWLLASERKELLHEISLCW